MSCPHEHLIVRMVGGELPEAAERELREHAAACPTCAEKLAELRATWDEMGAWHVDSAGVDLTDRVLAGTTEPGGANHPTLVVRLFGVSRMRAAASIALAAGLGIAAGTLVSRDRTDQGTQPDPEETRLELVDALGLTALATDSATGLAVGFEPEPAAETEVEP